MDNLRGSLLMVAAMAAFALEDMFVKALTRSIPVGQALVLFGLGGMVVFIALARRRGETPFHPAIVTRPILIRSVCEVGGRLCYTLAIALTPLSSASAILQATPLVVAAGAVVFFGQKVGWRRWAAIAVGFVGVLIILRPGMSGFTPASWFAVLGTLGFAGRDLATRAAPVAMSNVQLGVVGFAMLIVAGAPLLAWTGGAVALDGAEWALLAGAVATGVAAYYALTAAMRVGEIAIVAPFRYTRLVFAMALGALVFAERPDAMTLLGSAVIVGSGLYTVLRARRQKP
ncbi:MAG: drug/metabolite transporter (DMT)-like permease [Paracoccaceae bacterium]